MSTNGTFHPNALANPKGVAAINGQYLTVQFLTANPTNVANIPEIWFNLTDFKLYTWDGALKKSSVAQS